MPPRSLNERNTRMKKFLAAAGIGAALVLTGCSGVGNTGTAHADACAKLSDGGCTKGETTYLQVLQGRGFDVSDAGDWIRIGKSVCGPNTQNEATGLWRSNNGKLTMGDALIITSAANAFLCRGN